MVELCCDPRGMTEVDPTSQRQQESPEPGPASARSRSTAEARASRLGVGNMIRSLLPLVLICLAVVGWFSWQQDGVNPVRPIQPADAVRLAASKASYPLLVPVGLPAGYRPTSVHSDAPSARRGGSVTLQIGYVTPSQQFAGFAESDDPHADALASVLDGATQRGTVDLAGHAWTRLTTTTRGETALTRTAGTVTVVVTGSASEKELETVAAAVQPYSA